MDVYGFLVQHGVSGFNSLLLVALFLILRGKFTDIEKKVNQLWNWHLVQIGRQKAQDYNQEEDHHDD